MNKLLLSVFVICLAGLTSAVQPPVPQYCSRKMNTSVRVPRDTVQVAVNCWQAEFKRDGQKGPWQATGYRSESFTGVYAGEIPGQATVTLPAYTGENGGWGSCEVVWTVQYE